MYVLSTISKENSRDFMIDFLRVISCISVIVIHVTSIYINSNSIAFFMNQCSRFAVPMFVIISGYSLELSRCKRKTEENGRLISKYIKKVIVPYVVWTLIYIVYNGEYYTFDSNYLSNVYRLAKWILLGYGHLYFIPLIIQLYIILPCIRIVLDKIKIEYIIITTFIISSYFQVASYLVRWYIFIVPVWSARYAYILFPSWIFYFVFGIYRYRINARMNQEKIDMDENKNDRYMMIFVLVTWILSLALLMYDSKLTNTYGSSIKPTVMIYSICTYMLYEKLYCLLKNKGQERIKKLLYVLADKTLSIYFCHILILSLIRKVIVSRGYGWELQHIEGIILVIVLTFSLSLCFTQILRLFRHNMKLYRSNH